MLFGTTKAGHMAQILVTAATGQLVGQELTPPSPDQIETYGRLIIQILVGVVTIWATVRKALQKPETVLKVPAVATVTAPATIVAAEAGRPDGNAQ